MNKILADQDLKRNLKTNIQYLLHEYPRIASGVVKVITPDKIIISWHSNVKATISSEHGLSIVIENNMLDHYVKQLQIAIKDKTINGAEARFRSVTQCLDLLRGAADFDSQLCAAMAELQKDSR